MAKAVASLIRSSSNLTLTQSPPSSKRLFTLPGVAITTMVLALELTVSRLRVMLSGAVNFIKSEYTCCARFTVGRMTTAWTLPLTLELWVGEDFRILFIMGSTKHRVLPDPVSAVTERSRGLWITCGLRRRGRR